MEDTSNIYMRQIMELAKAAKAGLIIDKPDIVVTKLNPMCGDEVKLSVVQKDNKVIIGYEVRACILCLAATKKLNEIVINDNRKDKLIAKLDQIITMFDTNTYPHNLDIFAAVKDYKARHECVLLPFKALAEYLKD